MALVTCDAGELTLLSWMLNSTSGQGDLTLKLYKTNVTPTQSSTSGSFTVADFTGYSNKTLSRGSWGSPSTVSHATSSVYADQTWTNSGSSQTIYGYFVVDGSSNLLWAELFDSPRVLGTSESLTVTPAITLNSAN
jgi:hypothetical protein